MTIRCPIVYVPATRFYSKKIGLVHSIKGCSISHEVFLLPFNMEFILWRFLFLAYSLEGLLFVYMRAGLALPNVLTETRESMQNNRARIVSTIISSPPLRAISPFKRLMKFSPLRWAGPPPIDSAKSCLIRFWSF